MLGVFLAWTTGEQLSRTADAAARGLLLVALFSLLVFAPVSAYFVAFSADWSYAYLVDPARLPSVVDMGFVLLDVVSVPAGFAVATRRVSARSTAPLLKLAAVPAAAALAFLLVASPRLAIDASYAQFHGDFGTRSVAGSPLGFALIWMSGVLVLAVTMTARTLRQLGGAPRRG